MRMRGNVGLVLLTAISAACAVRLGGPKPEAYTAVVARAAQEDAATAAARLRASEPQLVLLAADRDSAWFAAVAQQLGLKLSGPGRTGPSGLAFFTSMEAVGDSSLVLSVTGGGRIHLHDALYPVDKERHIDLMLAQIEAGAGIREAVRALLGYYATDVGTTSAVVLGIETATVVAADSVALLIRSAFGNLQDCGNGTTDGATPSGTLRLYYGPQARIDCARGRAVSASPPTLSARVVVGG